MPKGFEDISNYGRRQAMKRRRFWKPGGHPRRTAGSMRLSRRKNQQTASKIAVPRKEAAALGTGR